MNTLQQAVTCFAGQNIGARKPRRVLTSMYASLFWALSFGIVFGLLAAKRGGEKGAPIPWGPSIALGAWVTALAGEPFIRWYLSLL